MYEITQTRSPRDNVQYHVPLGGNLATFTETYADPVEAERHLAILNALPEGSSVTRETRTEKLSLHEERVYRVLRVCGPEPEDEEQQQFNKAWKTNVDVDTVVAAYTAHTEHQSAQAGQRRAERQAPAKSRKPRARRGNARTYTCSTCRRRRPVEDRTESSITGEPVCQDCWDQE